MMSIVNGFLPQYVGNYIFQDQSLAMCHRRLQIGHKANNRRQEALAALTTADWQMLVYWEFQAEQWYVEPEVNGVPVPEESESEPAPLAPQIRHNGNGVHSE